MKPKIVVDTNVIITALKSNKGASSETLSVLGSEKFLEERAKQGNRRKFLKILKNSPNIEPEDFDKM